MASGAVTPGSRPLAFDTLNEAAAAEHERSCRLERARAPGFKDHLLAIPRDDGMFERMSGA